LFGPRSLLHNNIGDEGAQYIGEALKINKALTTLKCALTAPQLPNALALLSAGGADVCDCSLFYPCSLHANNIGDKGAWHIGEALKMNKALTNLECAPDSPRQSCQMSSL
jgi:hypothetical protein